MYYDVQYTRINKAHYKPTIGVVSLVKSVCSVIVSGVSPFMHSATKRRIHYGKPPFLTEKVFDIRPGQAFHKSFVVRDQVLGQSPLFLL